MHQIQAIYKRCSTAIVEEHFLWNAIASAIVNTKSICSYVIIKLEGRSDEELQMEEMWVSILMFPLASSLKKM